jgi:hypothetical protein
MLVGGERINAERGNGRISPALEIGVESSVRRVSRFGAQAPGAFDERSIETEDEFCGNSATAPGSTATWPATGAINEPGGTSAPARIVAV